MKLKNIFNFICMSLLTILGVLFICSISLLATLNSNGIMKAVNKTGYFDTCENDMKQVLLNYLPEEKADSVLKKIDVETDIIGIINSFDSNKVEAISIDLKESVKKEILLSLDDSSSQETKEEFANVVSEAYISEIFPASEFSIISNYYNEYSQYIMLASIMVGILCAILSVYLITSRSRKNWLIVSMYNIIILSIIAIFMLSILNNIVIGDELTTEILLNIVFNIRNVIILCVIFIFIISIVLNYLMYFRKHKKQS